MMTNAAKHHLHHQLNCNGRIIDWYQLLNEQNRLMAYDVGVFATVQRIKPDRRSDVAIVT